MTEKHPLRYDATPESILDVLLSRQYPVELHIEIARNYHVTARLKKSGNHIIMEQLIATGLRYAAEKMGLMESRGDYIYRTDKELRERFSVVDRGNPVLPVPADPGPSFPKGIGDLNAPSK